MDWTRKVNPVIAIDVRGAEIRRGLANFNGERGGDHCHFCNTTWGHLLVCLKDYAERGVKNPYFK